MTRSTAVGASLSCATFSATVVERTGEASVSARKTDKILEAIVTKNREREEKIREEGSGNERYPAHH